MDLDYESGSILGCVRNGENISIKNSYNNGKLKSIHYDSGGISGDIRANNVYINNCTNYANIELTNGAHRYSGIVSYILYNNYAEICNCINYGNIVGNYINYYAGISSNILSANGNSGKVYNCINYGNITTFDDASNAQTGGIAGICCYGENLSIENCFNYGDLGKETIRTVSGIAIGTKIIKECANYGTLQGIYEVTGICRGGYYNSDLTIENSFNKGDIYAVREAAGISLESYRNIKNSYNARKNLWISR